VNIKVIKEKCKMAVSKAELLEFEYQREKKAKKKFKNEDKLDEQINREFQKLNNRNCYDNFDDVTNKSFYNLLSFLTLLEKKCEKTYGKQKKYKKGNVETVLKCLFPEPTKAQKKTIEKINKFLKKNKDSIPELEHFKFNGIMKSKEFTTCYDDYDWDL
jgi:hypothetical protein